jgi:CheY-like chemotaxis protein/GGDEF domain-containing protein
MPKGRVLAVDDQRYFRELIEGLLSEEGYEVQTASSGEEALHLLERQAFDVVVTDLAMPVMSGFDLVQRIKQQDPGQDIVVITGVVDVKSAVDAMKVGANDYLLKPFDRESLCASLDAILDHRRLCNERDRLLEENIEYMGERSLFERALSLFGSLKAEVLSQRLLDGLGVEIGAQGGVFWLDTQGTGTHLELFGARGLVRPEEESAVITPYDLPEDLRSGKAASRCMDWEDGGIARPSLVVVLRRGDRLIGVARLTDKLGGDEFDDVDRGCAEKFAQFAERAFENAERFRDLERRTLQDPQTGSYRVEYLRDVARNEIEKANRFGRGFSLARLALRPMAAIRERMGEQVFAAWWTGFCQNVRRLLRATDLLAIDDTPELWILLAECDAIGAATFKRRTRLALEACDALAPLPDEAGTTLRLAVASYPRDATQLESLMRTLNERILEDPRGAVRERGFDGQSLAECLGELLRQGAPEPAESCASLVRFALGEVGRRPRERNLFFFHPGGVFEEALAEFDTRSAGAEGTQVVVLANPPAPRSGEGAVSWLPAARLPGCPPFLVHYGDGPAYLLVCDEKAGSEGRALFHSDDPGLAEYLAFRLQRELRLPVIT